MVNCKVKIRCKICYREHHTILHQNSLTSYDVDYNSDVFEPNKTLQELDTVLSVNTLYVPNCSSVIKMLLATLKINFSVPCGTLKIWALLDPSSQGLFVPEQLVQGNHISCSNTLFKKKKCFLKLKNLMREYETLEHMSRVGNNPLNSNLNNSYLPHHSVFKRNGLSSKIKVLLTLSPTV